VVRLEEERRHEQQGRESFSAHFQVEGSRRVRASQPLQTHFFVPILILATNPPISLFPGFRCQRCGTQEGGSPFLSPRCSEEGGGVQLEGGLTVESVAWGRCGVLLNSAEGAVVGERFMRNLVSNTEQVLNTPEEIDEVVLDGCEKTGQRQAKLWHTLQVSSGEGLWQGLEPLSWNEGDDPFVIARLFCKYNDLADDRMLRPIYSLIVQRHAALRNRTLGDAPPPWDIPSHLVEEFTMGGRVAVGKHYVDESSRSAREDYEFGFYRKSRSEIDAMVESAHRGETRYYRDTDSYLYKAIQMIGGIQNKDVVIMGSLEPWYESVCLAHSASSCTTIEYNELEYDHPGLKTYTVEEFVALSPQPRFDVALSISTFEHDGLGRYGDPIDPDGDLSAMQRMTGVVREGGVMLLAVPVGKDLVYWNAHRKYGRVRLPVLFQGWTVRECGFVPFCRCAAFRAAPRIRAVCQTLAGAGC